MNVYVRNAIENGWIKLDEIFHSCIQAGPVPGCMIIEGKSGCYKVYVIAPVYIPPPSIGPPQQTFIIHSHQIRNLNLSFNQNNLLMVNI